MKYSTNNIQASLTIALAEFLRSAGFDVYWQGAGGVVDQHTSDLDEAKGIVTLVPDFPSDPVYILPANPTNIQRLKSEGLSIEEVVVPALSLQVIGGPQKGRILGLGHREYEWVREVRIDGLAADQFQHRELADLLFGWLQSEDRKEIPVYDYDANPTEPEPLAPVEVISATAERQELIHEVEAIRYYVRATTRVTYVE
jgi:hypothetical protein